MTVRYGQLRVWRATCTEERFSGTGGARVLAPRRWALLTLAGCASLPHATAARVAKAPTAYETAKSFSAPVADWPADALVEAYGDPPARRPDRRGAGRIADPGPGAGGVRRGPGGQAVAAAPHCRSSPPQGQVRGDEAELRPRLSPSSSCRRATRTTARSRSTLTGSWTSGARTAPPCAAAASDARAAAADAAEARLVLTTDVAASLRHTWPGSTPTATSPSGAEGAR